MTLSLVDECQYDGAFTFIYSPREGTPAARMQDNVPAEVKSRRLQQLNEKIAFYAHRNNEPYLLSLIHIFMYGEGISHIGEVVSLGESFEIINKSGAWFSYNGEKIGQGREAVRAFLKANPQLDEEITAKIKHKLFHGDEEETPTEEQA